MRQLSKIASQGLPTADEVANIQIPSRITDALARGLIKDEDVLPNLRCYLGEMYPHPDPSALGLRERMDRHMAIGDVASVMVKQIGVINRV